MDGVNLGKKDKPTEFRSTIGLLQHSPPGFSVSHRMIFEDVCQWLNYSTRQVLSQEALKDTEESLCIFVRIHMCDKLIQIDSCTNR